MLQPVLETMTALPMRNAAPMDVEDSALPRTQVGYTHTPTPPPLSLSLSLTYSLFNDILNVIPHVN